MARDWEAQQSLLHRCGNLRHARLTPRMAREQPVFEAFNPTEGYGDVVVVLTAVGAFGAVVVLALKGLL